jgi:hypothetical protein
VSQRLASYKSARQIKMPDPQNPFTFHEFTAAAAVVTKNLLGIECRQSAWP